MKGCAFCNGLGPRITRCQSSLNQVPSSQSNYFKNNFLQTYLCYCINKVLELVLRKSTIPFEWNSLPSKMKCCFHCTDLQTNGKTCSYLTRIGLYCVERVCSIPGPVRGPVVHFPLPRKEKHNTCNYEAI